MKVTHNRWISHLNLPKGSFAKSNLMSYRAKLVVGVICLTGDEISVPSFLLQNEGLPPHKSSMRAYYGSV